MSSFDPATFASICQVPLSQLEEQENIPGWHTAPDDEKDSPSTGDNASSEQAKQVLECQDQSPDEDIPAVGDRQLRDVTGKNAQDNTESTAIDQSMIVELDPVPESPIAVGPTRIQADQHDLQDRSPAANTWTADALPFTQAPGMEDDDVMTPNPPSLAPLLATADMPAEVAPMATGAQESGSQHQGVLGTITRVVLKPFGFGRLATGMFTNKKASEAAKGSSLPMADKDPTASPAANVAAPASPKSVEASLLSRLPPSPRAEAVKQGLQIIEHAHQLGPEALHAVQARPKGPAEHGQPYPAEVIMGRGDSAVAEAINEAVQDPRDVAAAVVAVEIDGTTAKAILPAALEGTELGEAVAQESAAIARAVVQQHDALAAGSNLSRKRSADEAVAEEEGLGEQEAAGTVAGPKRRRRFLKGMEVIWAFFGKDNSA